MIVGLIKKSFKKGERNNTWEFNTDQKDKSIQYHSNDGKYEEA